MLKSFRRNIYYLSKNLCNMAKLVIVDNDCGVDDAWALNFLVNFSSDINILAITCVNGNTSVDNVCHNNLYFLKLVGKHSEIPVFKGADQPIIPKESLGIPGPDHHYFHGRNGLGDVCLPELDLPKVKEDNAIAVLDKIASEYKGQVSLICLGPLTNIALALRTYPKFKDNIKDAFIMGGNYTSKGNTTMSAEFNFHVDPEAAHIVLSELASKITLLPWEACLTADIRFEWREELGQSEGKIMSFFNTVERPLISRSKRLGYKHYICADQLLAAIFINKEVVEDVTSTFATVELSGMYTRGQVVTDHLGVKDHNIQLITKLNLDIYKKMLLKLKHI